MAESAWASTPTEQRGPSRPTRVLLVEDNPEEALLLEEVLSQVATVDFDLEHVTTLELAIERLSRERAIDVVLLDLGLPDAEGLEAVRRIHGTHPAAPSGATSSCGRSGTPWSANASSRRSGRARSSSARPRRWRRSAVWPAASRTTSTTS